MRIIYNIAISFYRLILFTASFFNEKAGKWIKGRRNILTETEKLFSYGGINNGKLVWFHCASLGEFEQARPLIERLKQTDETARIRILVTFFSPSGYEIRKNFPLADHVLYLPSDTHSNAARFINAVKPSIAVFVKYEFWYHFLSQLKKNNTPVYLVSATFRKNHIFFKWYGSWFRNMLKFFDRIFVQDEGSKILLDQFSISSSVSGDTRFDRVYETAVKSEEVPWIEKFRQGKKIIIAGSTWEADEKVLRGLDLRKFNLKLIIAPHEIHEQRIQSVLKAFSEYKTIRFSHPDKMNPEDAEVLIIDNIGLLSKLYRYGAIAYVGGAFGKSLHNILEAAAFGLPVLFGPNHDKFWEADALIEKGGAFVVQSTAELNKKVNFLLRDEMILKIASEMSRNFVRSNTGATEKILSELKKHLLN